MQNSLKLRQNNDILSRIKIDELFFVVGIILLLLSQFLLFHNAPYVIDSNSKVYEQLGVNSTKNIFLSYSGYACLLITALFNMRHFFKKTKIKYLLGISIFIVCLVSL